MNVCYEICGITDRGDSAENSRGRYTAVNWGAADPTMSIISKYTGIHLPYAAETANGGAAIE